MRTLSARSQHASADDRTIILMRCDHHTANHQRRCSSTEAYRSVFLQRACVCVCCEEGVAVSVACRAPSASGGTGGCGVVCVACGDGVDSVG